ncbi:MAG: hypothetical protein ABH950_09120, partial [Candidatus Altiarchaeota archaeon]
HMLCVLGQCVVFMARLGKLDQNGEDGGSRFHVSSRLVVVFFVISVFVFVGVVGFGTGAFLLSPVLFGGENPITNSLVTSSMPAPTSSSISSSSTSTSISSVTSSTSTSSIMFSTTSTPDQITTTSIPCGREYLAACTDKDNKPFCDEGYIIGSEGTCAPVDCAPTTSSGKDGCGSFALSWCTSEARNL